ncbi:MAG: 50S ribosomal protein L32e [Sulfolobales archaeon]|nr:50S ribosomal protein L32e [Sulfolobales archaeon]MDW8083189.1 50S ribosomal protein L32e [Sulfolobales archaeon]
MSKKTVSMEDVRKLIRRKLKISFYRNKWWKFTKFRNELKWKKPRGKDNPMRLKLKGQPPAAASGYETPVAIRGLHPSGLKPVVVNNIKELDNLDPARYIVYIGSSVGLRKKIEIIRKAQEMGFRVANAGGT